MAQTKRKRPTVVYALEDLPSSIEYRKSIFFAGPTPRDEDVDSWRPEALELLEQRGYDGVVFVPELRNGRLHNWKNQVEWEERCLFMSDCAMFWVPRDLEKMPGINTSDEWGFWKNSGKAVYGAPPEAIRVQYQRYYADKLRAPQAETLEATVDLAITMVADGALRTGGEREVPLHIWRTPWFQQWYAAQRAVGNRLDHARQVLVWRTSRGNVYLWILHVDVYVASEQRNKSDEFVIGRPDISSVLLYRRNKTHVNESEVVLVREYRSPVSNPAGFVYELPGGSDTRFGPLETAVREAHEEAGFEIAPSRLQVHDSLQVAATLSTHRAHLFSAEITAEEMDQLRRSEVQGTTFGAVPGGSERTSVVVMPLGQIRHSKYVDWSTRGMILSVLDE